MEWWEARTAAEVAAAAGDVATVQRLVEEHGESVTRGAALMACAAGQLALLEAVEPLLAAAVLEVDTNGDAPDAVIAEVQKHWPGLVCFTGLLEPLYAAAVAGHAEVVALLVARGANRCLELSAAAARGDEGKVAALADALGAEARQVRIYNFTDVPHPLLNAALHQQHGAARLLLDRGYDVNTQDNLWFTPLFLAVGSYSRIAAAERDDRTVRLLLEAGADPNICTYEGVALAVALACPGLVRVLVAAGADPTMALFAAAALEGPAGVEAVATLVSLGGSVGKALADDLKRCKFDLGNRREHLLRAAVAGGAPVATISRRGLSAESKALLDEVEQRRVAVEDAAASRLPRGLATLAGEFCHGGARTKRRPKRAARPPAEPTRRSKRARK